MVVPFLQKSLKKWAVIIIKRSVYEFPSYNCKFNEIIVVTLTSEWRHKVDTCFKDQFSFFVSVLIVIILTWLTSRNDCSRHASALHHCSHPHLSRFPSHAVPGKIYRIVQKFCCIKYCRFNRHKLPHARVETHLIPLHSNVTHILETESFKTP